ncbi:MAG: peptidyl-tRNA hydrolase Pth2 [Candidatus Micrarchaeota archaeon]|nr:peptidyl-tRNA hydrolase Pth2 [Candidatus Micrarchaeota archaeon]
MYKQAIVIRKDLKMSNGKMCGQCSHASVTAYKLVEGKNNTIANSWFIEGQKKIVLKVNSEDELMDYFKQCKQAGIPCELIRDAGHTQLEPGTVTCFGAGPWDEREINKVLGKLKLL